jgi:tetratricopeptide (TPR) repeat protein
MFGKAALAFGISLTAAGAAHAHSVTVIGNNAGAIACFRAADSEARRPDAIEICSVALRSSELDNRDRVATLVNRGIVHFRLEQFPEAIADFDSAMAIEPRQADAMVNRGITMLAAGEDVDRSLGFIDEGLRRGPQRPWVAYYGRAVGNELAGRDAAAYHDYQRAQQLRPGWALPRRALARFSVRG